MRTFLRDTRRWLPGTLISLALIALLAFTVDWRDAATAMRTMDWRWLLPYLLLYFASTGLRALVSRVLLENRPTWLQSYLAMNQGYLMNNVLPLRLGELGRAYLLGRAASLGSFRVLSAIVIERAYDLAFAAMLLIGTLPFVLGGEVAWARPAAFTTLGLVLTMLLSLHLIARFRAPVRAWVDRVFGRIGFLRQHALPRLDSFMDGLSALTSLPRFLLSFALMALVWLSGALNYYLLLLGFVPDAPLWATVFSLGVVSLGIAVPSAPAGIGVFEGAMVAALSVAGIDGGKALAYAILLHVLHIVVSGVIGGIAFARQGESVFSIAERLQRNSKET